MSINMSIMMSINYRNVTILQDAAEILFFHTFIVKTFFWKWE